MQHATCKLLTLCRAPCYSNKQPRTTHAFGVSFGVGCVSEYHFLVRFLAKEVCIRVFFVFEVESLDSHVFANGQALEA